MIIPTKSNINLLLPCIDSFYEHCNSDLFDIFIVDTGSSDEEKNQIKTSKIDNDVLMPNNITINNKNYEMKGSIHHAGSLNGGHYVYFHKFNDIWTIFNDENITDDMNERTIINKGYIYLYEKLD